MLVGFDSFIESTGVKIRVTQTIVGIGGAWPNLQRPPIGTDGFFVFALLHFAKAHLNPDFGAPGILVHCVLETRERALIVSQPEGIKPVAIPDFRESFRLLRRSISFRQLIESRTTFRKRGKARRRECQIYVLPVSNFDGNDADDLTFHIEQRTAAVAMGDRNGDLDDFSQVGYVANRGNDPITH